MTYLLVIDSGNTAIKWGLVDKDKWIDKGVAMQTHRDSLGDGLLDEHGCQQQRSADFHWGAL